MIQNIGCWISFCCLGFLLTAGSVPATAHAEDQVELHQEDGQLRIVIAGQEPDEFAVLNYSTTLPKPYFDPVRGPGGEVMTEVRPSDHTHHQGVWISLDEVNHTNFWGSALQKKAQLDEGEDPASKIENQSLEILTEKGNPAVFRLTNHWIGPESKPILKEQSTFSVYPNRLMSVEIVLTALDTAVQMQDTKEGLFAIRVAASMKASGDGKIVNSDGAQGEKDAWGRTADWVDYHGPVDGNTVGVALFDDPSNFRRSRYHVRNYGLFSVSPFGESAYTGGQQPKSTQTLQPGQSLRLRYGMYVHAGDHEEGTVAQAYEQFLNAGAN